ncbi:hypothetical protein SESBI_03076 [Sesbania bispinosa]|nr:hypothetical protein SESBI_03076 [Sesbania bispinosa]
MGANLTDEEYILPKKEKDEELKVYEKIAGGSEQNESERKLPYSPDLSQRDQNKMFDQFIRISKGLQISIPFLEAMEDHPTIQRLLKIF